MQNKQVTNGFLLINFLTFQERREENEKVLNVFMCGDVGFWDGGNCKRYSVY
jgi:hypothetical protein